MKKAQVLVLTDQEIIGLGLENMIREGSEFEEIRRVKTLDSAEAIALERHPELILVAIEPLISAVHAVRRLSAASPSSHLLAFCRGQIDAVVGQALVAELRQVGACGLLPSNLSVAELRRALQDCLAGNSVFPSSWPENPMALNLAPLFSPSLKPAKSVSLTLRQTQVLSLVAEGLLNKEIAERLGISIKTVEKHRQSVKERLHTGNTADLTRRAIEMGLVQTASLQERAV